MVSIFKPEVTNTFHSNEPLVVDSLDRAMFLFELLESVQIWLKDISNLIILEAHLLDVNTFC
jgi:hypothetical protein